MYPPFQLKLVSIFTNKDLHTMSKVAMVKLSNHKIECVEEKHQSNVIFEKFTPPQKVS